MAEEGKTLFRRWRLDWGRREGEKKKKTNNNPKNLFSPLPSLNASILVVLPSSAANLRRRVSSPLFTTSAPARRQRGGTTSHLAINNIWGERNPSLLLSSSLILINNQALSGFKLFPTPTLLLFWLSKDLHAIRRSKRPGLTRQRTGPGLDPAPPPSTKHFRVGIMWPTVRPGQAVPGLVPGTCRTRAEPPHGYFFSRRGF